MPPVRLDNRHGQSYVEQAVAVPEGEVRGEGISDIDGEAWIVAQSSFLAQP